MKPSTQSALRDRELLATRDMHFSRLEKLYAGQRLDQVFALAGVTGSGQCDPYQEPEQWTDEALDDLAAKADALHDQNVFRPLVFSLNDIGYYGVHFIDRILGANVFELRGEKGNWQVGLLQKPVGSLKPPDLDHNPTWQLAQRMAAAFVHAGVSLPLFGMPCLSSVLNVGLNLYGQELLVAMMTDPVAAHRDMRIINDLLCTLHHWYRRTIPVSQLQPVVTCGRAQPPGYGQLCGCSTQLVSADLYRHFIAPFDGELLSAQPRGGMIHLCGTHTQHIPAWREMENLRAIQINDRAAEDLELYFNGLRDDQIIYVNPCGGMPLDRIMDITGGRRLVVAADIKDPPVLEQRRRRSRRR